MAITFPIVVFLFELKCVDAKDIATDHEEVVLVYSIVDVRLWAERLTFKATVEFLELRGTLRAIV